MEGETPVKVLTDQAHEIGEHAERLETVEAVADTAKAAADDASHTAEGAIEGTNAAFDALASRLSKIEADVAGVLERVVEKKPAEEEIHEEETHEAEAEQVEKPSATKNEGSPTQSGGWSRWR